MKASHKVQGLSRQHFSVSTQRLGLSNLFWSRVVLWPQKDQSRLGCWNHCQELVQARGHILKLSFIQNQHLSQFVSKLSYWNSDESVKSKRLDIFAKKKKPSSLNWTWKKALFAFVGFKVEKTGNEYLLQLDLLLTLLPSDLAHYNVFEHFFYEKIHQPYLFRQLWSKQSRVSAPAFSFHFLCLFYFLF